MTRARHSCAWRQGKSVALGLRKAVGQQKKWSMKQSWSEVALVDQLLQHQKCLNVGSLKCDFIDAPSAVSVSSADRRCFVHDLLRE
jgi:hypothetical protein